MMVAVTAAAALLSPSVSEPDDGSAEGGEDGDWKLQGLVGFSGRALRWRLLLLELPYPAPAMLNKNRRP